MSPSSSEKKGNTVKEHEKAPEGASGFESSVFLILLQNPGENSNVLVRTYVPHEGKATTFHCSCIGASPVRTQEAPSGSEQTSRGHLKGLQQCGRDGAGGKGALKCVKHEAVAILRGLQRSASVIS
ncbi:unnamed protein product [Ectocarpus sp. 13 AM-2016]